MDAPPLSDHPDISAPDPHWPAWFAAAAEPTVDAELRGLYARLDADVAARSPTCWQSGECCHFDAYGHRLYVTALEVAWFLRGVSSGAAISTDATAKDDKSIALPMATVAGVCPYQVNKLCTTHTIRPLGCRIFFCQAGTQEWQSELYEGYLSDLRVLHDKHGLHYRYADWLALLDEARDISGQD